MRALSPHHPPSLDPCSWRRALARHRTPIGPMIPFQMGEARGNRTPEPPNPRTCAVAMRSIPPPNTTMGIGGSKGYGRTTDPCTGCSLLYTTTTTSPAFVVTGVCPSPESQMLMTPSGRGTTRCFLTPGMRSPSTPPMQSEDDIESSTLPSVLLAGATRSGCWPDWHGLHSQVVWTLLRCYRSCS